MNIPTSGTALELATGNRHLCEQGTVDLLEASPAVQLLVVRAATAACLGVEFVEDFTDLLGSKVLTAVDPQLLTEDEWDGLCSYHRHVDDPQWKFLLTNRLCYPATLPAQNLVCVPSPPRLSRLEAELTALMLRRRKEATNKSDQTEMTDETPVGDWAAVFCRARLANEIEKKHRRAGLQGQLELEVGVAAAQT